MSPSPQSRFRILLAFALVYVFWGSTYLGIGIAVEHIPAALMCAVRFLISGPLMLLYCAFSGRQVRFQPRQLARQAAVGLAHHNARPPGRRTFRDQGAVTVTLGRFTGSNR